ncbi:MAG: ABC transporter permease [Oscillospiraceae bacterium]|nr:ABC transporter permease [Oscillospiraceae bacterium]
MKRILKWFLLLNKRLYKKLSFILILLLIPVLVFSYSNVAEESSGVITIALAQVGDDAMASGVIQKLIEENSLVRFLKIETPQAAKELVEEGDADAAWIFPDDMEEKVYRFVASQSRKNAFIQVVERDSSVPVILAREKLSGAMYENCSKAMYLSYIRNNVPELKDKTEAELLAHYDAISVDGDFFRFSFMESSQSAQEAQDANYLLTPVRGLLAVVTVLSGLAMAMYYMRDDRAGTFSWIPERKQAAVEFGCQMICVLNVSAVVLIALTFGGLVVSLGREVLILLLYAVCTALFSMTVRRLCGKMTVLGTVLPLLIVVMLVICPVFFDLGMLRNLQYIFPPTYYINAQYSDRFLVLMGVYSFALLLVYYLTGKLLHRK